MLKFVIYAFLQQKNKNTNLSHRAAFLALSKSKLQTIFAVLNGRAKPVFGTSFFFLYLHKLNAVILGTEHLGLAQQGPVEQLVIGRIVQRLHLQDTQRHKTHVAVSMATAHPEEEKRGRRKGVGEGRCLKMAAER